MKRFSPVEQDIIYACLNVSKTPSNLFVEWNGKYTYQYIQSTMRRLEMLSILGKSRTAGRDGSFYRVINKHGKNIQEVLDSREIRIGKEKIYRGGIK